MTCPRCQAENRDGARFCRECGATFGAVCSGCGDLQAAELLDETGLYPDLEYAFKHALTHEVTYSGLLHERRRDLHARVVGAIETLHGDRMGEQIGARDWSNSGAAAARRPAPAPSAAATVAARGPDAASEALGRVGARLRMARARYAMPVVPGHRGAGGRVQRVVNRAFRPLCARPSGHHPGGVP
jgi:hypothetical protein